MSCLKPLSFGEICYVAIVADAHSLDPTDFPPPKSVGFCLSNRHQYVIVIRGGGMAQLLDFSLLSWKPAFPPLVIKQDMTVSSVRRRPWSSELIKEAQRFRIRRN